MAKMTGINNTSFRSFELHEFVTAELSGLLKSAQAQLDENVSTFTDKIDSLFGEGNVEFDPLGLATNTASKLKYMVSGSASDASLGFLEIKGNNLPTYDTLKDRWNTIGNKLTMSSIGFDSGSDLFSSERFSIDGVLGFSRSTANGEPTEKIDFLINKVSIGNSDLTISLITDKLKISAQEYSDGSPVSDPIISGTIKGIQIDLANDAGIYNHISLGFTIGAVTGNKAYLSLNSIALTEDGTKLPLMNVSDTGIKFQDTGESTVITRGSTTWDQEGELWDFVFGGNDSMQGTSENDSLDGGGGNDTLIGLDGDDIYYVDSVTDVITEKMGEGIDMIVSSARTYTITAHVEQLILEQDLIPNFSRQDAVGNSSKNHLTGNSLSNYLYGKDGNDTLTGGDGQDRFVFDTKLNPLKNVDTIIDFIPGEDKILLNTQIFKQSYGSTKTNFFSVFDVDTITTDTRIIYDQNKYMLYYDADGSKAKYKPVLFAKLIGFPELNGELDATYFSFANA